jgi:tRNA pseudouridine38-40 synthase
LIGALNVKLVLEYDGTRFHGWQEQPGSARTVEGSLRAALRSLTGEAPLIAAAGRTDAGVHALGQAVSFRLEKPFPVDRLPAALNARLAPDAAARTAELVDDTFHARRSAQRRHYAYRIRQRVRKPAYERQYAWAVPEALELGAMRAAARRLVGTHDFRAFGRSPRAEAHTVRRIHELTVEPGGRDGEWMTITVVADAFLYGMVRRIAGALVAVGRGRRPPEWIDDLLQGRAESPEPAPPQGLTQLRVDY